MPRRVAAMATGRAITLFARVLTAVQAIWQGALPDSRVQRIYYANHSSHGDFILVWSILPTRLRQQTRPVAGADYWGGSGLRAFIGRDVFNALLIERQADGRSTDPVETMAQTLDEGSSLILFPEGTRNLTDEVLLPFKSGLYHLAKARPKVELVPVWIENLNRVLPKGSFIPVPLMCRVILGAPLWLAEDESKEAFLTRSRDALLALKPGREA